MVSFLWSSVPWLTPVTHSDFSQPQLSPVMDGETGGGGLVVLSPQ